MPSPARSPIDILIGLLLFGVHLFLYWSTLPPGLAFEVDPFNPPGDTHEFTMAIAELRLTRRTGYPLYTWLGAFFAWAVPFGEVAYRTNLMSAIFGAGAAPLIYAIGRRIALQRAGAAIAAVAFAIATTFWSQAVITEVYTLNVLALGLVVFLLLGWSQQRSTAAFVKFAFAYGVSIGCHTSNLALGLVFALFVLFRDRGILRDYRTVLLGVLVAAIGLAQYVWIPLMAETAQFPNPRPDSALGFYRYTLGAFSNLRFAFPLQALPGRFLRYLNLLHDNFTVLGIIVGSIGIWAFWRRQSAHCALLLGMFSVNVFIAMQVYATDIEVFFLPSYIAWALFVGVGAETLWWKLPGFAERYGAPTRRAVQIALLVLLCGWTGLVTRASFAANDRTQDTAFEDFYHTVFSILPLDSYLASGPGVFGQGAIYFQRVLGVRPDVTIHTKPERMVMPREPVYSALRVIDGRVRAPFAPSPFPPRAWAIPVLVGHHSALILYRIDRDPPQLLAPPGQEDHRDDEPAGTGPLASSAISVVGQPPNQRLQVELRWNIGDLLRRFVLTRLDGKDLDRRPLGFGNLARYYQETGRLADGPVLESYDLVLPRAMRGGEHTFEVGLLELKGGSIQTTWFGPESFSMD